MAEELRNSPEIASSAPIFGAKFTYQYIFKLALKTGANTAKKVRHLFWDGWGILILIIMFDFNVLMLLVGVALPALR